MDRPGVETAREVISKEQTNQYGANFF